MEIIAKKSYLKSFQKLSHIRSCTGSRKKVLFYFEKNPI